MSELAPRVLPVEGAGDRLVQPGLGLGDEADQEMEDHAVVPDPLEAPGSPEGRNGLA